jgi:hypothetical protein
MAVAIFIKSSDASAKISSREFKHPHLLLGEEQQRIFSIAGK